MHPPSRGTWFSRPRVHIGFHRSWTTNDLNLRVKQRIVEILKGGGVDKKDVKLYITGGRLALPWLVHSHIATPSQLARICLTVATMLVGFARCSGLPKGQPLLSSSSSCSAASEPDRVAG